MSTSLTVATDDLGEAVVVHLRGDVTGSSEDVLALRDAVSATAPPGPVLFDLSDVRLLTAAGARTLLDLVTPLDSGGVRCRFVVDGASAVADVLRAAGLPAAADVARPAADRRDPDLVQTEVAALTRALVDATTVGEVLSRVVTAALAVIPGADLVSVTLRDPSGVFFTPADTDAVAQALDAVQYRTGAGPCLEAARPDGPAFAESADLVAETRWPEFAESAVASGFAAVLAMDLPLPDRPATPSGALNVYSHHAGGLTVQDRYVALLLASHAALALAHVTAAELFSLERQQLLKAVRTRDVIGQAKGILMARQGMTADEAFDLLRRTSQHLNVKLVELARELAADPGVLERG